MADLPPADQRSGEEPHEGLEQARQTQPEEEGYRLYVTDDSTVLVRIWDQGGAEVAMRAHASHTWGPPVSLVEERH